MGKKSRKSSSPMKTSKHEKKPQLNNLTKNLRPKVYITDSSSFKSLVQQLTGNGNYAAAPPPPTSVSLSPPAWEVPFVDTYQDFHHDHNLVYDQENMSSSVGVSSASPELSITTTAAAEDKQRMEIYKGLEAMLMEMDSDSCDFDAYYDHMFQQDQVCVYDYDLSNFV